MSAQFIKALKQALNNNVLMMNEHEMKGFSNDFGTIITAKPLAVVKPIRIGDIRKLVVIANKFNIKVIPRGSAHTTGGQTLVDNGVVIDMSLLTGISGIDEVLFDNEKVKVVKVAAGTIWKELISFTLKSDLVPQVYSDWLYLTVGGTLSTGGVGQASLHAGLQLDNVIELEVITGGGHLVKCNKELNNDLFYSVLGGLGHFGIIVKATVKLIKAPKEITVYKLIFNDMESYIKGFEKVIAQRNFNAIQSWVIPALNKLIQKNIYPCSIENMNGISYDDNNGWLYVIELTKYDKRTNIVNAKSFLPDNCIIGCYDDNFENHINRIPPIMVNTGINEKKFHHHCCLFIPKSKLSDLLIYTLPKIDRTQMDGSTILIIPIDRSIVKSPTYVLPKEGIIFFVGFLRGIGKKTLGEADQIHASIFRNLDTFRGNRYLCDTWPCSLDSFNWCHHFGQKYDNLYLVKKKYDPNNILASTQKIFP